MNYRIKLFNYIQDAISDDIENYDNELDNLIRKETHEPIFLFAKTSSLIKKASDNILLNINGIKFYKFYDSKEWEIVDGTKSKINVTNIDCDSWMLNNHINLYLENNPQKSWTILTDEKWVKETININSNLYFTNVLQRYYEEIKLEHKDSYNVFIKTLSKHVITHNDDNIKINKFNWIPNISNLGFIFKYFETSGYIQFPKNDVNLALENLMTMFNIKSSEREMLREYLLNDSNKIEDKRRMFNNVSNKHQENTDEFILKLPNIKYLRKRRK